MYVLHLSVIEPYDASILLFERDQANVSVLLTLHVFGGTLLEIGVGESLYISADCIDVCAPYLL